METTKVVTAAQHVWSNQKQAAASREPLNGFNYSFALGRVKRRLRRELKQDNRFPVVAGRRKPRLCEKFADMQTEGRTVDDIAILLGLSELQVATIERYLAAPLSDREPSNWEGHHSVAGDIVGIAYINWRLANFENWQARCAEAAKELRIATPLFSAKAIDYAHGEYWLDMRGTGETRSRRDKLESDKEKRLYTIASEIAGKARKGEAKTIVADIPASLGGKAKTIAQILSTGASRADCADILGISRPTVSVHCQKIAAALTANGWNEQPAETVAVVPTVWQFRFIGGIGCHDCKTSTVDPLFPWVDIVADKPETVKARNRAYVWELVSDYATQVFPYTGKHLTATVAACGDIPMASLAVYRREPSPVALGSYTREALAGRVKYAERLRQAGNDIDGLPICSPETEAAATEAAATLASLETVSREPSPVALPEIIPVASSETVSRRRDCYGEWETVIHADDNERRAVALTTAFAQLETDKLAELVRRNNER